MMLRRISLFMFLIATGSLQAQQLILVEGKVTYLSIGTVYGSIGRESGLQDSTRLYIVAKGDTVAALKVTALSSKSCACAILNSKRDPAVGDRFVGLVPKPEPAMPVPATIIADAGAATPAAAKNSPAINLQGRVSLQYFTSRFDNNAFDYNQPGVVLNLHSALRDVPLTLDIYSNFRRFAPSGVSPFSAAATNQSRIYRLSLEYNDRTNDLVVGRIIPNYAPSIGSIDGVSYSRRFGNVTTGVSLGFQPDYQLRNPSFDNKKMAVFAQYQTFDPMTISVTGAYSRTYFRQDLDREAVSLMVTAFSMDGFSVYGYSDIDLRRKSADRFLLAPSLSTAMFTVNYQLFRFLSVGIGADASRAVYPYSMVRDTPDSLLDRSLRSGATVMLNVSLMPGIGISNTYTPRASNNGFGSEYSNYSSFYVSNVLSSGAQVRATYNLNENSFTTSHGYGVNIQRDFFGFDCTVRYQQSQYKIVQISQANTAQTFGADVMKLITRQLSLITSFDSIRGYGSKYFTVFSELSWRF